MKKMFFLIMMAIMVIGCKDEEIIKESNETEKLAAISSKGREVGMLRFGSVRELEAFVAERVESKSDLLDEARAFSDKGIYNPLLMVYNLEAEEAKELGIEEKNIPTVASDDDMLLLMLNQDGEIGIEDKIFRIDEDFVYTYVEGGGDEIDTFLEKYNGGGIKMENGQTIEFSKGLTVYKHDNAIKDGRENLVARNQTGFDNFNNNHRMKSRQFHGYWVFYSSIGAKTLVEQRRRFLWWSWWKNIRANNSLQFELSYRVNSTFGFPPVFLNASGSSGCTNCNQHQRIYNWSVGFPAAPNVYVPLDGMTRHQATWNGITRTRTLFY
ncbi:hypothetical protein [Tenacibaculum sp. ZS6-P6]|uniref:hypothetical protein n=1 Tax=Tenacibaculum sp. ZS6-P6 TaxID=3447503 RepID=UPI003F99C12A